MHARLTAPDYGFTLTDAAGHQLSIDIPVDQGGQGRGFRPMQTLLAAFCGCSGVDMVSILKKQRQSFDSLEIKIDGEREKGKEPSLWETVEVEFSLTGSVSPEKPTAQQTSPSTNTAPWRKHSAGQGQRSSSA